MEPDTTPTPTAILSGRVPIELKQLVKAYGEDNTSQGLRLILTEFFALRGPNQVE